MAVKRHLPPQYLKNYPQRVPDWRWQQAASGLPLEDENDPFLKLARDFYNDWKRAAETQDYGYLYAVYKDFYIAWEIFTDGEGLRKSELEARILARESFDDIAKKMGLTKEAIVYYEAVFFNVTDKLDSPSYILHHALDSDFPTSLNFESGFWKFYGYWCGPKILDLLIYRNIPKQLGEDADFDRIMLQNLQQRLIIMLTMDDFKNKRDFLKMFELYSKRAEAIGGLAKSTEQTILNKIGEVLISLKWDPQKPSTEKSVRTIEDYVKQSGSASNPTDS